MIGRSDASEYSKHFSSNWPYFLLRADAGVTGSGGTIFIYSDIKREVKCIVTRNPRSAIFNQILELRMP